MKMITTRAQLLKALREADKAYQEHMEKCRICNWTGSIHIKPRCNKGAALAERLMHLSEASDTIGLY